MFILPSLGFYGLYFLVRKRKAKWIPWFTAPVVLALASCTFALSDAGGWVGSVLGLPVTWFGSPAVVAVVIVMLLLLIGLILDLAADRKADKFANTALVLIPLLALGVASPISDAISKVVHPVGNIGPAVTAKLSGQ